MKKNVFLTLILICVLSVVASSCYVRRYDDRRYRHHHHRDYDDRYHRSDNYYRY